MNQSSTLAGRRILVVEDEFLIRLDIVSQLEAEGAEVVEAGTLAEGRRRIEMAEGAGFDGAVIDINLPDGESWPLAEALAARGVTLVIHSAHVGAAEAAGRLPGVHVLSKPSPEGALPRILAAAGA